MEKDTDSLRRRFGKDNTKKGSVVDSSEPTSSNKTELKGSLIDDKLFLDSIKKKDELKLAVPETESELSKLERYITPLLLTGLSFFTRYYKIGFADKVVWDEAHFGKFGTYYIDHHFYHDVHPPLGKMLVGLASYISGSNGTFKFDSGQKYPADLNYTFPRMFLANFGIMMVPLAYFTALNLGMSRKAAALAGLMVLFDNALCVISRFILLDSMVLGFTALSFFFLTGFHSERKSPFSIAWWIWLMGTGISLGLASSVKWVGFFVVALAGLYTVEDLYEKFGDVKMSKVVYIQHWISRIIGLIVLPAIVYLASFYAHFTLLSHSGSGDSNMSSLFQHGLKGSSVGVGPIEVAFGSKITIRNYGLGGGLLHSHPSLYPAGSKQHQVTIYHHSDNNNDFVFLRTHEQTRERNLKKGKLAAPQSNAKNEPQQQQEQVKAGAKIDKPRLARRNDDFEPEDAKEAPKPQVPEEPKLNDGQAEPAADNKPKDPKQKSEADSKDPILDDQIKPVKVDEQLPKADETLNAPVENKVNEPIAPSPQKEGKDAEEAKDAPPEIGKIGDEKPDVDTKEKEKKEEKKVEKPAYSNDYLDPDEDLDEPAQYIQDGDIIRLSHIGTGANLHSHKVEAHVSTKDYEVSGYLTRNQGDSNDYWKVEIYDDIIGNNNGKLRLLSTRFRLKHVTIGCYLAATDKRYPDWGFGQGEVVCKRKDDNSNSMLWNIEAHKNKKLSLPAADASKPKSPFLKNFIDLNLAMWKTNNALIPDQDKDDALTSQPYHWPLMLKGIRMCGWGDEDIKFYMLGNPLVWWASTFALLGLLTSTFVFAVRFKRKIREWYRDEWEDYLHSVKMISLGWFFQYIPYYIMGRVMYVHHYFPALYFSIFALPYALDLATKKLNSQTRLIVFGAFGLIFTVCFIYFAPMTFGMDFPAKEFESRHWIKTWKLTNLYKE